MVMTTKMTIVMILMMVVLMIVMVMIMIVIVVPCLRGTSSLAWTSLNNCRSSSKNNTRHKDNDNIKSS